MAEAISERPLLPALGSLAAGPSDAAETLVFLHGWGGSKEHWWNTLTSLADTHRLIALDLPGTGGTPMMRGRTAMADFAVWFRDICQRLDLVSLTLIGHSMGGNLAAQVALDEPGLVRRLVLVDAALEPSGLPVRSQWPLSPRHGLTALRLLRWSALPLAAAGWRVPHTHSGGEVGPAARRARLYVRTNSDAALQIQLAALLGNSLDARKLAALRMPLLIVHGAMDPMVSVSSARMLAAALPHARLKIFPKAFHVPMDSDPPSFARALREFCV